VHQAPERFGIARVRWRLVDLRQAVPWLASYTLAGIWRALRRLGVRPKRGRLSVHRPDPRSEHKCCAIALACALAHHSPHRVRVLSADEVSVYRQPTLAAVHPPAGRTPKARLALQSNTRYRISGAMETCTGQVCDTSAAKMGVTHLCAFLPRVRSTYPHHHLFVVWDNCSVHHHATVLATAARLHLHLLWLPTSAPWTTPIEQLWRWLKQTLFHHHRFADRCKEHKDALHAFLDQFAAGAAASTDLLRYVGLVPD
jgi:transposase